MVMYFYASVNNNVGYANCLAFVLLMVSYYHLFVGNWETNRNRRHSSWDSSRFGTGFCQYPRLVCCPCSDSPIWLFSFCSTINMFTLFHVLAKLGWTLTHGSSVHENRGGIIKHDYATSTLPENINDFLFSKFAQENFQVSFLSIFPSDLPLFRALDKCSVADADWFCFFFQVMIWFPFFTNSTFSKFP